LRALICAAAFFYFNTQNYSADLPQGYTRFCARCGLKDIDSFVSQSEQFVVHGGLIRGAAPRLSGTNATRFIQAEPQLVALMGERVARAIAHELRLKSRWADTVHVTVFDLAPAGQSIGLISHLYADGFDYKMSVPGHVEGTQLLKGLLQALLLEFTNRGHRRSGELPNWLVEGMVRQIQTTVVPTYVVNRKPITIEKTGYDRLGATRDYFQTNALMTLHDLSFADLTRVTSEQREQFEASSHLLVHELLRLPGGPALMAQFLQTLPTTHNWQTAFYSVYKQHFDGPLAFEKWWMLSWVHFKNGQERDYWPVEVALDRLESVLFTAMEVRTNATSVPVHREATLQEFIERADFATQKEILSQKVQQMFFMSLSVPNQALPLWEGYHRALETYLYRRDNDTQPTLKIDPEKRLQTLIKDTLQTLDQLDSARNELKAGRTPVLPKQVRDTNRQASR
jgi:hypothetical protein